MAESEARAWFTVSHAANGNTTVTCVLAENNLTVKWAVKTYASAIKEGVVEAEAGARKALDELRRATG